MRLILQKQVATQRAQTTLTTRLVDLLIARRSYACILIIAQCKVFSLMLETVYTSQTRPEPLPVLKYYTRDDTRIDAALTQQDQRNTWHSSYTCTGGIQQLNEVYLCSMQLESRIFYDNVNTVLAQYLLSVNVTIAQTKQMVCICIHCMYVH